MISTFTNGKSFLRHFRLVKKRNGILFFIFVSFFQYSELKSQNCNLCSIPSFPSLTVYQSFQTGHGMGFGVEAGTWNKDAGKFSYFFGTSLVWAQDKNSGEKINTSQYLTYLSFYLKGQYKITNHLYLIAAPGIVNLSYFDLKTGFRYVVPITRVIGIGIEPAYSFNQKQLLVNANMHFALR